MNILYWRNSNAKSSNQYNPCCVQRITKVIQEKNKSGLLFNKILTTKMSGLNIFNKKLHIACVVQMCCIYTYSSIWELIKMFWSLHLRKDTHGTIYLDVICVWEILKPSLSISYWKHILRITHSLLTVVKKMEKLYKSVTGFNVPTKTFAFSNIKHEHISSNFIYH